MITKQDFIAYQESITGELRVTKNRVRNLIGQAHWQTDGEHKETILRQVLSAHLPESVRVGKGFICYPEQYCGHRKASYQIDILITNKNYPTLMKEGDLVLVTAETVEAIIEVKSRLPESCIEEVSDRAVICPNRTGYVSIAK